jgi:hypothetical protein
MTARNRTRLFGGLLLVLVGGWLMAIQIVPELKGWSGVFSEWPMSIIGVGILLLVLGLLFNTPGLAIPACIVGGIGGILLYQTRTGDLASWSYIWSLIPGFVGVGVLLTGLFEGKLRRAFSSGIWLIFISAVLFIIFGAFLGGVKPLADFWPVLIILLGLWLIGRAIFRK